MTEFQYQDWQDSKAKFEDKQRLALLLMNKQASHRLIQRVFAGGIVYPLGQDERIKCPECDKEMARITQTIWICKSCAFTIESPENVQGKTFHPRICEGGFWGYSRRWTRLAIYPQFVLSLKRPVTSLTIVENSREVTDIVGQKWFSSNKNQQRITIAEDTIEHYLQNTPNLYDTIYLDIWGDIHFLN